VRRVSTTRHRRTDLLARPPCNDVASDRGWTAAIVDPVGQLEELAHLCARGLLSREEFDGYRSRILEVWAGRT